MHEQPRFVEVITDLEIFRAARQMTKRYGQDAGIEAALRLGAMIEASDPEGQRVWQRTLKAIDELLTKKPSYTRKLVMA